uniref:Uncharacterized protein n=1 Tax=Latimeria chalumnae TaxID=7897 RepID=M3XIL2_LATCH|nr:PREDICTED: uncharacterized protein C6orf163 homolog isoform X1 [Latimeria chalumnae]|eukprot:XP_006012698.1 PREDICTED: uncharacterized protein C6orf163 homolog isoform X1 [Latimeria chalumnae]
MTQKGVSRSSGTQLIAGMNRIHEFRPFVAQSCTHMKIIEIGTKFLQEQEDHFEEEKKKCIQKAREEASVQGEQEKEQAVAQVLKQLRLANEAALKKMAREHQKEIKEIKLKLEAKMQQHLQEEVKKEHKGADKHLTHEVQQTLQKCEQQKLKAVAEAKEEGKQLASQAALVMEKQILSKLEAASTLAKKENNKALDQLRCQKAEELRSAVAHAQHEQQEQSNLQLRVMEIVYQANLELFKKALQEKEASLQDLFQQLEAVAASNEELEKELEETRGTLLQYISNTYPLITADQLAFILPPRKERTTKTQYCSVKQRETGLALGWASCAAAPDAGQSGAPTPGTQQ